MSDAPSARPPDQRIVNFRGDPEVIRPLIKAVTRPGERQCDALARILREEARKLGVEVAA